VDLHLTSVYRLLLRSIWWFLAKACEYAVFIQHAVTTVQCLCFVDRDDISQAHACRRSDGEVWSVHFLVQRCNCVAKFGYRHNASSAAAVVVAVSLTSFVTRMYCDKTTESRIVRFLFWINTIPQLLYIFISPYGSKNTAFKSDEETLSDLERWKRVYSHCNRK